MNETTYLKLGYARVSTDNAEGKEQTLSQQTSALEAYGVDAGDIYQERISGKINLEAGKRWLALRDRALESDSPVEIVIVDWSRLSREMFGFLSVVNALGKNGAVFTVLGSSKYQRFAIQDSSDGLMLAIEAFGNQAYREKISKATKEKLAFLKGQGVAIGRPKKLTDEDLNYIAVRRAEGFGAGIIAKRLTTSRIKRIPAATKKITSEYEKALKHARVSKTTVYQAFAILDERDSNPNKEKGNDL